MQKAQSLFVPVIRPQTVFLAAGAVLAYSLFKKGSALSTLNFYPKGVKQVRFDGITPVVTLALAIQNTSGQNMVVRSFAGNLYANGYFLGNASSYTATAIRPNSETIFLINVRMSVIGVVQDIIKAFNAQGPAQALELDAKANVENYQIPIKIKYKIG